MSGHNHNEGGAHGPEATPGKVGLREKLTHPHGHKDHPKDESDGGDPVHELPTHAQKDAYSAGWAQGPPTPAMHKPPVGPRQVTRGVPHPCGTSLQVPDAYSPLPALPKYDNNQGAVFHAQRLPRAANTP